MVDPSTLVEELAGGVQAAPPVAASPRLRAGAWLHEAADGSWRLVTGDGAPRRVRGDGATLRALSDALTDARTGGTIPAELVPAAVAVGVMSAPASSSPGSSVRSVAVLCDDRLGAALRAGLPGTGLHEADQQEADVWLVGAAFQTDARFRALDRDAVTHGVAWHRAFREGDRWSIGPFSCGAGTATYEDYRIRRLSADAQPQELEQRWAWFDRLPANVVDPPSAIEAALIAALMLRDVAALAAGATPPGASAEWLLDPKTGTLDRHPVLPLPIAPTR